jgi:two-component system, OmpR family, phosphate regulon sensor histidine kinase PhoR
MARADVAREKIGIYTRPDRMASLLRYISFIIFISLILTIAVGLFLRVEIGYLSDNLYVVALVIVLGLFTLPFVGFYVWSKISIGRVETLAERIRAVVGGEASGRALSAGLRNELHDLARVLEEWDAQTSALRERFDQSRALTVELLDAIGEGLLAIDGNQRVVLANVRLAEMFELRTPMTGRPFLEVVRSTQLANAFDSALEGKATTYRDRIVSPERSRTIEVRVFPVHHLSDAAAVALFIDVTQIEMLELIRRDFIADFSHEVRTPMAGLRTAIESFDGGGLSPENEAQLREVILRQLSRLERLVRDLSELNEIESGGIVLKREPVELRELLDELAQELGGAAPHGVVVSGPEVSIDADRLRIEQIFSNLIDNAIKYGGQAGAVGVEVSTDGTHAIVRVSDSGPGVPALERERIFHRFYRVDRSRSRVSGSGLGLSITKHLVQLHAGTVSLHGGESGGATFEVTLPLRG